MISRKDAKNAKTNRIVEAPAKCAGTFNPLPGGVRLNSISDDVWTRIVKVRREA